MTFSYQTSLHVYPSVRFVRLPERRCCCWMPCKSMASKVAWPRDGPRMPKADSRQAEVCHVDTFLQHIKHILWPTCGTSQFNLPPHSQAGVNALPPIPSPPPPSAAQPRPPPSPAAAVVLPGLARVPSPSRMTPSARRTRSPARASVSPGRTKSPARTSALGRQSSVNDRFKGAHTDEDVVTDPSSPKPEMARWA